jgi:hypothetical protein
VAGLFCHAQQNSLTVLEQSKAMGIRGAAWSALVRSNSVSSLTFMALLQRTNIDVDQH